MPVFSLYSDEQDLSTMGVFAYGSPRFHDSPQRKFPLIEIPGWFGSAVAGNPTTEPRELVIPILIQPSPRTLAARVAAEDKLKALQMRGLITIARDDQVNPPRAIDGYCLQVPITPDGHPDVALTSKGELRLLCPNATWRSVTGSVVHVGTLPSPMLVGTAPSGGILRVGADPLAAADVTGLTITYLNQALVAIRTMTIATTLVRGRHYLELDLGRQTILLYDSTLANPTAGAALLTSGDFFAPDPTDGVPYIMLSATTGTPVGSWTGYLRYL